MCSSNGFVISISIIRQVWRSLPATAILCFPSTAEVALEGLEKLVGGCATCIWKNEWCRGLDPHRIHGIFIYIHEWLIFMVNVGKYTSPMDPMGSGDCWAGVWSNWVFRRSKMGTRLKAPQFCSSWFLVYLGTSLEVSSNLFEWNTYWQMIKLMFSNFNCQR